MGSLSPQPTTDTAGTLQLLHPEGAELKVSQCVTQADCILLGNCIIGGIPWLCDKHLLLCLMK
jgi:hypothetical protein